MIITNIVVSVVLVTNVGPQINPILYNQGFMKATNVCRVTSVESVKSDGTSNVLNVSIPIDQITNSVSER